MAEWINGYQAACSGATIDYQANGSGAGITDFINKQTAFAGSDSALKDDDKTNADARCATGPAIDIPMVGGAIVAAYNVDGRRQAHPHPGRCSPGIFGNTITKWNDPKIAAANPGVTLPDATIAQFHRSDSSGTTDNFTKFLAHHLDARGPSATRKEWTAPGGQGAKGSDGVASGGQVHRRTRSATSSSPSPQDGKLSTAVDRQRRRAPVEPTSENAAKTIADGHGHGHGQRPRPLDRLQDAPPATRPSWSPTRSPARRASTAGLVDLTKSFLTYTASDAGPGEADRPRLRADHRRPADQGPHGGLVDLGLTLVSPGVAGLASCHPWSAPPTPHGGQQMSTTLEPPSAPSRRPASPTDPRVASVRAGDRVFRGLSRGAGILILVTMAAIAVFLIWRAIPSLQANTANFFTTEVWFPDAKPAVFGIAALDVRHAHDRR